MNINEFTEMEKICKDSWRKLAESGSGNKPQTLGGFHNYCPACHIAIKAKSNNYSDYCKLCPIKHWRKKAMRKSMDPDNAVCDMKGEIYNIWRNTQDIAERKQMALKISRLKWEWMSEYYEVYL